jgi:hypothetical protein
MGIAGKDGGTMRDDSDERGNNNGSPGDGWDAFDWNAWGETSEAPGANGRNGVSPRDDAEEGEHEAPAGPGQWVSQGGVLRWEQPGDVDEEEVTDARAEARSHWAGDEVELPPGVPDTARIRATRAWLLRQRTAESDAVGYLLLERRKLEAARTGGATEPGEREERQVEQQETGESPLDLALIEHQAAIEAYDKVLAALEEVEAHNGPQRVLVEFHLWLNERLAMLAAMPEAPAGFAERVLFAPVEDEEGADSSGPPATPRSEAEWQGCAEAILQARRRVERVTAPEPED